MHWKNTVSTSSFFWLFITCDFVFFVDLRGIMQKSGKINCVEAFHQNLRGICKNKKIPLESKNPKKLNPS
jgi:hypothetical protein